MDAKTWRDTRYKIIEGLRGTYLVYIPDVISLLEAWKSLGINLDNKDFGKETIKPEIIKGMLLKYLKDPKVGLESTPDTLGIDELMADQTDVLAIYTAIISEWTSNPDKIETFFRTYIPTNKTEASDDKHVLQ